MGNESMDHKRLLIEIEKAVREVNRATINPITEELGLEDVQPILNLVARTRAAYLRELFTITEEAGEGMPSVDAVKKLRQLRTIFEELRSAAQALQIALERGYLDTDTRR